MAPGETDAKAASGPPPAKKETKKPAVDLEALAERILKLMKEEARIERERMGLR